MARPFQAETFQTNAFQGETVPATAALGAVGALSAFSPLIGVEAKAPTIGAVLGETATAIRIGGRAAGVPGARGGATSAARVGKGAAGTIAGQGGWLTYGGLGFQLAAFQSNAFQVRITERVNARPAALLQETDTLSGAPRVARQAAAITIAQRATVSAAFIGVSRAAMSIGARGGMTGIGKSGRLAQAALGVRDDEISRFRSDASDGAILALRTSLISTSTGIGFKEGFQPNAFEQTVDNVPRAHMFAVRTVGAQESQSGIGKIATAPVTPPFASRENYRPVNVAQVLSGVTLNTTQESFRLTKLVQLFVADGRVGIRASRSVGSRIGAGARSNIGQARGAASASARVAIALTRAIGATARVTGFGLRFVTAAAQTLAARVATSALELSNQRPAASSSASASLAPATVRVTARPLAALTERSSFAATTVSQALSAARIIAMAAQLRGVGTRATSDSASFGQHNAVSSPGNMVARPAAAIGDILAGKTIGPVRVNARPIGVVTADAKIPATTTRLAAVADQALTAKLATPSIVRMGPLCGGLDHPRGARRRRHLQSAARRSRSRRYLDERS
jgi:hypothetical protein